MPWGTSRATLEWWGLTGEVVRRWGGGEISTRRRLAAEGGQTTTGDAPRYTYGSMRVRERWGPSSIEEVGGKVAWGLGSTRKRWRMHYSWRSNDIEIVKKRIFTVFHVAFPSVRGWQSPLQSLVMLCSSFNPLSLTTLSDTLGEEELSQVPMLRLTPSIGVRTSKLKRALARSEVTFSWIAEHDGYTKSHETKTAGHGVNQHQAGYQIDLANTKALFEWMVIGRHLWTHNNVAQR
jgi:hypothetical protein